jgi:hypothetical protein
MILTSHFRWNVKVSDSIFVRHWNSIRNSSSVPYIVLHGTVDGACFLRNFRRQFFQNAYSAKVLQTTRNTSHALTTPRLGEPSHFQMLAYRTTETRQVRLHKCPVLKSKAAHQHSSTTSKCAVTLASSAVFSRIKKRTPGRNHSLYESVGEKKTYCPYRDSISGSSSPCYTL